MGRRFPLQFKVFCGLVECENARPSIRCPFRLFPFPAMLVLRGISHPSPTATVLTIGNFDGVHRGHRALLARLHEAADRAGLPAAVLTFEPHPREFFAPALAPARLATLREKLELLAEAGVDVVSVYRFNASFAALSADQFIERVLVQGLKTRKSDRSHVVL